MKFNERKKFECAVVRNKPLLIPRILNNYARIIFLRQRRLKSVGISVGYECQCTCSHCSAAMLLDQQRARLSIHELKGAVNECVSLGAIHFNITGGEPLLYPQTYDLITHIAHEKRCVASLATNGILLDRDVAAKLKRCGLDVVQISLDDADEERHDRSRGYAGSFKRAFDGIAASKRAGLIVLVSAVATNDNLLNAAMDKLYALTRASDAILHINTPCTVGNWGKRLFSFEPRAKEKLRSLLKMPGVRVNTEASYFKGGCKAGFEKIYLSAYGDILPCQFIQLAFGNIRENGLAATLSRMRQVPYFNGTFRGCLASENHEFLNRYVLPFSNEPQKPHRHPATQGR